jgi:hypothetical protein
VKQKAAQMCKKLRTQINEKCNGVSSDDENNFKKLLLR